MGTERWMVEKGGSESIRKETNQGREKRENIKIGMEKRRWREKMKIRMEWDVGNEREREETGEWIAV